MTRAGEPSHCIEFRCLLEEALSGRADPPRLTELGWHEHLLGCGDCRGLLEAEEALELLLASLPDPKLPPDLRRRVLLRLRAGRQEPLESLLDLDHVEVPGGLARATTDALRERLVTGIDPLEAQLDAEAREQALSYESADLLEGLAAAREKRPARFGGR